MHEGLQVFARKYLFLAAAGVATALALALLGYFPTVRLAGSQALTGMLVGIGVSLLAGLLGAVPVGLTAVRAPQKVPQAVLLSTALRLVVVLALAASAILSGWFDRIVVGVWAGVSYLAVLAVDTVFAVHIVGAVRGNKP
jgi:hypothetical protein